MSREQRLMHGGDGGRDYDAECASEPLVALVGMGNTARAGACKRSVEASDLRLPPAKWPATLHVERGFGNSEPLVAIRIERDPEGCVSSVLYEQRLGTMQLEVFND